LPNCLEDIVKHLKNNLMEFIASFSEGIFGNFTSVFKTGILLAKIFKNLYFLIFII
jgi:hypothetical protein